MPTYYKPGNRKNNTTYVVRGYVNGRQYEITTNASHKRGAKSEWESFKAEVKERNLVQPIGTFSDALAHYEATGQRSEAQMGFARKIEKEIGSVFLETIRPGHIRSLAKQIYPDRKASTWNRQVVRVASAIINNAADDDGCPQIRIKAFKGTEVAKKHPRVGAGELLLSNTEGLKRVYIGALHFQGLRPSDALSIRWDNIDLKGKTFQTVVPKSKRLKRIVMDEDFWLLLANVPDEDHYGKLFPWANRSSIYSWLNPLCEVLGVDFSARKSRHKFASDLVAEGGSAFDLVNTGSWTDERSVKPYVTLQEKRAGEMLKRRKATHMRGKIRGGGGN